MPYITRLSIQNLRNLVSVNLEPSSAFNILYGKNGSGKTSVLESISVLSTNKSFRTHKTHFLVNKESPSFTLFCQCTDEKISAKIGIQRPLRGTATVKIDGDNVKTSSQLAATLPVISLEPSSFDLLDGTPGQRRMLLDWLVFHVKPEFLNSWKNYQRCLKQRNILLRHGKISRSDLIYWNELLCAEAVVVDTARRNTMCLLKHSLLENLIPENDDFDTRLSLQYLDGWGRHEEASSLEDQKPKLLEVLDRNFDRDLKQGFTSVGSHRHDLRVQIDNQPAAEILSRGQKKSLIVSFHLAMARVFIETCKRRPIFLLDDLPSELDGDRLKWLCEALAALDSQVFITSVNSHVLRDLSILNKKEHCSWFHVKHGTVSPET